MKLWEALKARDEGKEVEVLEDWGWKFWPKDKLTKLREFPPEGE